MPSPFQILQPPGYVVILRTQRMWWRTVPLDGRQHIAGTASASAGKGDQAAGRATRLHRDGQPQRPFVARRNWTAWSRIGAREVERLTPIDGESFRYEATVTDPAAFTSPWTLGMDMRRMSTELLEVACLEDDQDLPHLKDVRDEFRRNQKK